MQRFPLAPMSPLIYWMTVVMLVAPALLLWAGTRFGSPLGAFPAAFVVAIYLIIWFYMRPSRFEVSYVAVDVVWPVRRFSTPIAAIEAVELLSGDEFRARYGWGMRIGAGGLWGGFGLLKTSNETFRFYISRLDRYVLIRASGARALLITPAEPERFVQAVEAARFGASGR